MYAFDKFTRRGVFYPVIIGFSLTQLANYKTQHIHNQHIGFEFQFSGEHNMFFFKSFIFII